MASELEQERERLQLDTQDSKLYYDYEGRFVKQKLERDRMGMLPRVITPSMFSTGGYVLGGLRTFDRYTVSPVSAVTGQFIDLQAGQATPPGRVLPAQVGYVLSGHGTSRQGDKDHAFGPGDVVLVPPYTRHAWAASPDGPARLWLPQVRLWHVIGLLWHEFDELSQVPEGCAPLLTESGELDGFEVPGGVLGLEAPLRIRRGQDERRARFFAGRRGIGSQQDGTSKYDWFLRQAAEENRIEDSAPRVIRAEDCPLEDTRQGRIRFYLHPWRESVAPQLDLMVQEIEPGGFSGRHRHIAEEVLLVLEGEGYDLHEETRFDWRAGDIICVPTMASHQHHCTGERPARLVSVWPRERMRQFIGGFEHLADASSWTPA